MVTKRPGRPGKVRVTFALPASVWADTIHLVGDFNDWDRRATPLRQSELGWVVTLELDAGRSYQYRYLHNGHAWHNDWQADRYELNQFGGHDSVVVAPVFAQACAADEAEERLLSFAAPRLRLVPTG